MSTSGPAFRDSLKRPRRACDQCRRKKRRCDGGERCAHCTRRNYICTYVQPAVVLNFYGLDESSHPYDSGYIEPLKLRLQVAELSLQQAYQPQPQVPLFAKTIRNLVKPFSPPHPDDSGFLDIADSFRVLSIDSSPPDPGFQGNSSAAMLVKAAVEVRANTDILELQSRHRNRPPPRPWTLKPWETTVPPHNLSFPSDHLIGTLVSLYFSNVNVFLPLLHRPIFEERVKQRIHTHDLGFGTLVLLVCALGSLHLTNPPVSIGEREQLAWQWYDQVELCGHFLRQQPTLYDIQAYCLAVHFISCTSNARRAWSIAGFGVRLAQDIGIHRRGRVRAPTIKEELERRALWVLMILDTELSGTLGRSAVLDPVEVDIGSPWECDDECWQLSGPSPQPHDKPSVMAFFNCFLNLYRLFHFILRSSYTIRRSHTVTGTFCDIAQIAQEFDSALDTWFSSIPPHLIWDPERSDVRFFDQSAVLHCFYYYVRILVHRPFIPVVFSMMEPNDVALGICTQAARACIQMADLQRRRRPSNPLLFSQSPIFTAAMILILDKWNTTDELRDPTSDLALIYTSIDILKTQQERWSSSESFIIILERLVSIDQDAVKQLPDYQNISRSDSATQSDAYRPTPQCYLAPIHTTTSSLNMVSSNLPPISHANLDAAVEMAIPPAFVGDEEILPGRKFNRPRVIRLAQERYGETFSQDEPALRSGR
ncbi:fungal-specific transcription factor domain-containing protein [Mycena capillaripes]|nr:fungal-specific transcription factor domain-containing protein [Mycena capillaripes]